MTVGKDSFIQIRVSAEAKERMLAMAEVEGVSLSELLRRKVLEPSTRQDFGLVGSEVRPGDLEVIEAKGDGQTDDTLAFQRGGVVRTERAAPPAKVTFRCTGCSRTAYLPVGKPAPKCPFHGQMVKS